MGTTSAMLVKLSIATRPYRALEVASFDYTPILSISNSNLAPGTTQLLYVLGLDVTCISSRLLNDSFTYEVLQSCLVSLIAYMFRRQFRSARHRSFHYI